MTGCGAQAPGFSHGEIQAHRVGSLIVMMWLSHILNAARAGRLG